MDGKGDKRPKKRWMECDRSDMKDTGVSDSVTGDRTEWKKSVAPKTCDKSRKLIIIRNTTWYVCFE